MTARKYKIISCVPSYYQNKQKTDVMNHPQASQWVQIVKKYYEVVDVPFQSTSPCNISTVSSINSLHISAYLKKKGCGEIINIEKLVSLRATDSTWFPTSEWTSLITSSRAWGFFIILGNTGTHLLCMKSLWQWWFYFISIRSVHLVNSSKIEKLRSPCVSTSLEIFCLLGYYVTAYKTESTLTMKCLYPSRDTPSGRERNQETNPFQATQVQLVKTPKKSDSPS